MKLYEVELRAVITLSAQDMQKAALHGTGVIKENPHLIYVKAVHERGLNQLGSRGTSRPSTTAAGGQSGQK